MFGFYIAVLIATAQDVEFTAATPTQNFSKFPIKIFVVFFQVKNCDFSAIFGGFDFTSNYLEMNKII